MTASRLPPITKSQALFQRAERLIPSATQTLAKGPSQYVDGVAPKYLARGSGCRVWDVDGNEYIDLTMAVGPVVLGYTYPAVDEAIRQQLVQGITFSLMHPLEVEVAELLSEVVPGAEMVRYSKTGADATSAAVRVARAFTGRERVLCCGYHGWHDWYIGTTARGSGVPQGVRSLIETFTYNAVADLAQKIDDTVACVILEPVIFEEPRNNFLQEIRRLCSEHGALLIFDEMWTGFRVALGGAQEAYDVRADLATFSKAVANGMPISILTGRRDVLSLLDQQVFFYTTFGGEALSLAAAKATIHELRKNDVPGHLARQGRKVIAGVNAIAAEAGLETTRCVGLPCRSMVTFDGKAGDPLLQKSFVQQELIRRGILWTGFHNLSFSHTDRDVDAVLDGYRAVLPLLKRAIDQGDLAQRLEGKPVQPVFRKTTN